MSTDDWSTTPASNATVLGIDIGENCAAANVNDAIRIAMADLKTKLDEIDATIGTSPTGQPLDATLTALAALTTAADQYILATGANSFSMASITSIGQAIVASASYSALLTALGFGYSTTGTPGSSGWKFYVDIPFPTLGTLRINMGTIVLGANVTTTDAFLGNYTTVFGGTGGVNTFAANEDENWYIGNCSTSAITVHNPRNSTTSYFWFAFGLA
jgi:hypothetical protein